MQETRSEKFHPLTHLVAARVREFVRQPEAVFWVYCFPLIMVVSLGIAFRNQPVDQSVVVVADGPGAARIHEALDGNERFQSAVHPEEECRRLLRVGTADLMIGVVEEADRGERTETDQRFAYQYTYDVTKPTSLLARNAADDVLQRAAGRKDVVATRSEEVSEPGGRYVDFLVPGLLGMGLMGGGLWGVGFAIVDMRIRKLLKRYLATPMKRSDFLLGTMISRLLFMLPEIFLLLIFSRLLFGVTIQGSYLAVGLLVLLGAFQFSGIGLLVASRADTLETVSGLMNAVMVPMWIGSGIFFSVERFPDVIQPLITLLPLTPLITSLRAVMNEGASLASLLPEIGMMSAWGVVTFFLALRWFRWN